MLDANTRTSTLLQQASSSSTRGFLEWSRHKMKISQQQRNLSHNDQKAKREEDKKNGSTFLWFITRRDVKTSFHNSPSVLSSRALWLGLLYVGIARVFFLCACPLAMVQLCPPWIAFVCSFMTEMKIKKTTTSNSSQPASQRSLQAPRQVCSRLWRGDRDVRRPFGCGCLICTFELTDINILCDTLISQLNIHKSPYKLYATLC